MSGLQGLCMESRGRGHIILLADGASALRRDLALPLASEGFSIVQAGSASQVYSAFRSSRPDVLILSIGLQCADDGLQVLAELRGQGHETPCILLANRSSETLAIAAIRLRAADYLQHPPQARDLSDSIARCVPNAARRGDRAEDAGLVGIGAAARDLRRYIHRIAPSDSHVLVTGETGTGKGLVAQLIHRASRRAHGPLVSINCAAIPDTLLESELFGYDRGAFTDAQRPKDGLLRAADGGTVLLDEIGDMSLSAQAKILRVLEDGSVQRLGGTKSVRVDLRVVAATHQELERLMREGRFRADLFYRINVVRVQVPPLRERIEDLPSLVSFYLFELNRRFGRDVKGVADEAMAVLVRHSWPGNVRELKHLLEAIYVNLPTRRIDILRLPDRFRRELSARANASPPERARLLTVLMATNWNKSRAAQQLHWSRMTLYRKLRKYELTADVSL